MFSTIMLLRDDSLRNDAIAAKVLTTNQTLLSMGLACNASTVLAD